MKTLIALLLLVPAVAFSSPLDRVDYSAAVQLRQLAGPSVSTEWTAEFCGSGVAPVSRYISVVGLVAYGLEGSYVRGQVAGMLTVSACEDAQFKMHMGIGRHLSDDKSEGLDEWVGEASIEQRLMSSRPFIGQMTAAYGLDSSRRSISLALAYPF